MNWNTAPAGIIYGASQRFFVALGEDASAVAARINNEPAFVSQLALFAKNGGSVEPSASQRRAREIMGTNMFDIEDAIKHFGVNPSKSQLAALGEVPFSEETLETCKATHVLIAVFPMSILDIQKTMKGKSLPNGWYKKQGFAKERGEIGWHLVPQGPISKEDLTARVMIYTIIGQCKAKRSFKNIDVLCSGKDSEGRRVFVSGSNDEDMFIHNGWDGSRHYLFGHFLMNL